MSPRILIVDDDHGQRSLLESFLKGQGFRTQTACSGEAALRLLSEESYEMIISDVRMGGISGLEMLRRIRQTQPSLPVLLVTAFADIRTAVTAMKDGAVNYLAKPIDLDELLSSVRTTTGLNRSPAQTLGASPGSPASASPSFKLPPDVVSASPLMQSVFQDAALIAPSDSRVLITGESGSGKEVIADLIHGWSARASDPLVKVNCAAIPENLLESELFGHEKGAFTGAIQARVGRFEEADGGTLFLDEIGEMSPPLQAKLLRVINDGSFRRVGGTRDLHTDTRLLAATNRDLEVLITDGRFREDLFYRLNVMEIHIPPLRERPEDILPLATHFLEQFARAQPRFSASVNACLRSYSWPGNIRELRNAMERAALMSRGGIVLPEHLPSRILSVTGSGSDANPAADPQRLEEIEREAILRTLRKNNYNRTETARELAISRRTLTYKIQRLREQGHPVDPPSPPAT